MIATDFIPQFQTAMVHRLPTRSTREKEAFAALQVREQAWRFMNWQSRLIHPHPRQILKAIDFDALPVVQAHRHDIDRLLEKISSGDDLRPHLSEDVEEGYCLHSPGKKHGPDFDLLLNEWGIHHLHISHCVGRNGFNKRTKEVLYAIVKADTAYIIGVAQHGSWTSRQLVQAVVRSWPDHRLFTALGVMPGKDAPENEHLALRKAGVSTIATVEGRPWFSVLTMGLTTALVSIAMSREASRVQHLIRHAAENPDRLLSIFKGNAALNGVDWPMNPSIDLRWLVAPDRYCFGFAEDHSGIVVGI